MSGRVSSLALLLLLIVSTAVDAESVPPTTTTCSQITAGDTDSDHQSKSLLMCQLHESAQLLSQLGALVSEGIERLMANDGLSPDGELSEVEKRKHEYLRFGKRKHEYLRFGKRKHEYLRFGRK